VTLSASPGLDLACTGCGRVLGSASPLPVRCPQARPGDDIDHLVARPALREDTGWPDSGDANPFLRYRTLLYSWALARQRGLTDAWYVDAVSRIDARIAAIDGHGFTATPYSRAPGLEEMLAPRPQAGGRGVWVKDETGNVAGSHKARHLMGLALVLAVEEATGDVDPARPLAIASCGNAALAAAVVARACDKRLRVAIPTWADPNVVARLKDLGAELEVCERSPADPPGDPCFWRFRARVAEGAWPFTCQGSENGLTIDGGLTLGFELADGMRGHDRTPDRLAIQVGGGALASATIQALVLAWELGATPRLPALHTVQTAAVAPLRRAWRRFAQGIARRLAARGVAIDPEADDATLGASLRPHARTRAAAAERAHAAGHRTEYMRAVPDPAPSVATGILDDETYDWRVVVRGLVETGGWPVAVDEVTLVRARDGALARAGFAADATGTAGLAGLLALDAGGTFTRYEHLAVLITGARR
jgi:threonine synthase